MIEINLLRPSRFAHFVEEATLTLYDSLGLLRGFLTIKRGQTGQNFRRKVARWQHADR